MISLPAKPLLEGEAVSKLIPQKPPIEMVDKLWLNNETTTVSGLTIAEGNIFVAEGAFTEPGLLENIAQTAALRIGYYASQLSEGEEPPIGFIGAVKKMSISKLPKVGDELVTSVEVINVVMGVTIIEGKVYLKEACVAGCEMKIFLKE